MRPDAGAERSDLRSRWRTTRLPPRWSIVVAALALGSGAAAQQDPATPAPETSPEPAPTDTPPGGDSAARRPAGVPEGATIVPRTTIVTREIAARAGDTLVDVARRELGNGGLARHLAEFNELARDAVLGDGQRLLVPVLVPARGESARVVFVKGDATLGGAPLERDAPVKPGDTIVTGPDGFVSLEFSTGTVVNLQPDTTATVTRLTCLAADERCLIEISAERGDVSTDVRARDAQPVEFRVTTPFASAAVRGTVFDMLVDPQTLRTAVTDGSVLVEALGESRPLERGFGSVTQEGEPPGEPLRLLPAPVFRVLPPRAAPGDALAWFGLTGVASYAATVTRDRDGVEAVAELASDGERLVLGEGIPSGDYYVTLRGIDVNGLPGFPAIVRLGLADIDDGIAPVTTRVTREGQEFLVEIVDAPENAPGFEIQVSTTPDFVDPLSVDVAPPGRAVLRLETDTLYARARTLIDPTTVSAFGEISSGN